MKKFMITVLWILTQVKGHQNETTADQPETKTTNTNQQIHVLEGVGVILIEDNDTKLLRGTNNVLITLRYNSNFFKGVQGLDQCKNAKNDTKTETTRIIEESSTYYKQLLQSLQHRATEARPARSTTHLTTEPPTKQPRPQQKQNEDEKEYDYTSNSYETVWELHALKHTIVLELRNKTPPWLIMQSNNILQQEKDTKINIQNNTIYAITVPSFVANIKWTQETTSHAINVIIKNTECIECNDIMTKTNITSITYGNITQYQTDVNKDNPHIYLTLTENATDPISNLEIHGIEETQYNGMINIEDRKIQGQIIRKNPTIKVGDNEINEYYIFNNEGNNIECRNNPPQNIKNCTFEMTANQLKSRRRNQ